jgi:hypothetical protein
MVFIGLAGLPHKRGQRKDVLPIGKKEVEEVNAVNELQKKIALWFQHVPNPEVCGLHFTFRSGWWFGTFFIFP